MKSNPFGPQISQYSEPPQRTLFKENWKRSDINICSSLDLHIVVLIYESTWVAKGNPDI